MSLTLKEAKAQAGRLMTRLDVLGVQIQRTLALEAVAAVHNFTDWNRFRAHLERAPQPPQPSSDAQRHLLAMRPGSGMTSALAIAFADALRCSNDGVVVWIDCAGGIDLACVLPDFVLDRVVRHDLHYDAGGALSSEPDWAGDEAIWVRLQPARTALEVLMTERPASVVLHEDGRLFICGAHRMNPDVTAYVEKLRKLQVEFKAEFVDLARIHAEEKRFSQRQAERRTQAFCALVSIVNQQFKGKLSFVAVDELQRLDERSSDLASRLQQLSGNAAALLVATQLFSVETRKLAERAGLRVVTTADSLHHFSFAAGGAPAGGDYIVASQIEAGMDWIALTAMVAAGMVRGEAIELPHDLDASRGWLVNQFIEHWKAGAARRRYNL